MHFKKLLRSFPLWGKRWGGIWGANGFKNMGRNMGCQWFLKHGVEYGVLMVLKTWGGIWGANGFKNMGQNMGCQYKEVFNHFFGFSSKRRL